MYPRTFSREQLEMANKTGLYFPTLLPQFSGAPDRGEMAKWVAGHRHTQAEALAQKIADNIDHVSFERFIKQLKTTVDDFIAKIKGEDYVLWIPQDLKAIEEGCSDIWVACLALEWCGLPWPEAILRTEQLTNYLKQNPTIKSVLLLDDAAYSGDHLSQALQKIPLPQIFRLDQKADSFEAFFLENFANFRNIFDRTLYICIPFRTRQSENKVLESKVFSAVNLLTAAPIKTLSEILTEEELKRLPYNNRALTYFDHRLADQMSVLTGLARGDHLFRGSNLIKTMNVLGYYADNLGTEAWNAKVKEIMPGNRFIPRIISPYRMHSQMGIQRLREAIVAKELGKKINFPVPERYQDLMIVFRESGLKYTVLPIKQPVRLQAQGFFKPQTNLAAAINVMQFLARWGVLSPNLVRLHCLGLLYGCYKLQQAQYHSCESRNLLGLKR